MNGKPVGRITGAALLGGIVGYPVSHSLSPVIHNAWLEAGGIDAAYAAFAPRRGSRLWSRRAARG